MEKPVEPNDQTHVNNLAVNTAGFLTCDWSFRGYRLFRVNQKFLLLPWAGFFVSHYAWGFQW